MWDVIGPMLDAINGVLWNDVVLYVVLAVGVLFTLWSGFSQYYALTHGVQVIRGKYDRRDDPGAINHFQALSAALSATVGLGNIAGVAVAVALGGPGAVFWMWIVGLVGMALKLTEVTLSMLYRNVEDPDNPHGGPMWVAKRGFARWSPGLAPIGVIWGGIFCITLIISTITGGNMFQAWNVADVTHTYFGVPPQASGIVMTVVVGLVIIGGIKRIGAVAGKLVPFMCSIYLLAGLYVLAVHFTDIPMLMRSIVEHAFSRTEASGAFLGGTFGYALLWGMKRALFSSEAGQGSSPIAHSAAKTDEPVREAVVAGLEPFIDTLVVCTITALVILASGAWNRGAEAPLPNSMPAHLVAAKNDQGAPIEGKWTLPRTEVMPKSPKASKISGEWKPGDTVFVMVDTKQTAEDTGTSLDRLTGTIEQDDQTGKLYVVWNTIDAAKAPQLLVARGLYANYAGASLTAHAFDRVLPGLGKWLVVLAAWLFAISTMISWSYYGEQGVVYLVGERAVMTYKIIYCLLILVATAGWITTDAQLDAVTALGTGVMLFANIPMIVLFGRQAMGTYHDYIRRLRAGAFHPHAAPPLEEVIEGRDVE